MHEGAGRGILWDHWAKAWVYDPDLIVRYIDDYRNYERYEAIDRATAERITPNITGGEELPDEETIGWMFQWQGRPPQGEGE